MSNKERPFAIDFAPPFSPANLVEALLAVRYIYTEVYLRHHGTSWQRKIHSLDRMSCFEDQIGLRALTPIHAEEIDTKYSARLYLLAPVDHGEEVARDFQTYFTSLVEP